MELTALAARHRQWLAARQTAVAENLANASTPGFKARVARQFSDVLQEQRSPATAASHSRHLQPAGPMRGGVIEQDESASGSTHSGNTVDVERQLLTAGAINREYALNSGITRAFRRMLMTAMRA